MELPILLIGTDVEGRKFEEITKTAVVGLFGAKFDSKRILSPNQKIEILNLRNETDAIFRVVGQVPGSETDRFFWSAECVGLSPDFWGVHFPPLVKEKQRAARMLLQCGECENIAVSYLSDLETEVFDLTRCVTLFCDSCQRWTRYVLPAPGAEGAAKGSSSASKNRELRKHRRLPLRMRAWLQTREGGEEKVMTLNISAGGLSILSQRKYPQGSLLKVAFPYNNEGGSNIFVLAEVVRVSPTNAGGYMYYGIEYLR